MLKELMIVRFTFSNGKNMVSAWRRSRCTIMYLLFLFVVVVMESKACQYDFQHFHVFKLFEIN